MKKIILGLIILVCMTSYSKEDTSNDSATVNMSGFVYGSLEMSVERHMEFGNLKNHNPGEEAAYSIVKIKDSTLSDGETSVAKIIIDETAILQNTKYPESQYTVNLTLVKNDGVLEGASFKEARVTVDKSGRNYEVAGRIYEDLTTIAPGTYSGNFNIKATYEI